jgi:hypothetical protein
MTTRDLAKAMKSCADVRSAAMASNFRFQTSIIGEDIVI